MKLTTLMIAISIASSTAGCDPVRDAASAAGRAAGARAGIALADRAPARAKTRTDPRGGRFCDVMAALGWPPPVTASDAAALKALSPGARRAVVAMLRHGAAECGWRP